jgi:hypothetical protein
MRCARSRAAVIGRFPGQRTRPGTGPPGWSRGAEAAGPRSSLRLPHQLPALSAAAQPRGERRAKRRRGRSRTHMLPRPLDSYATPAPVPYLINVPALGAQLALEPPSTAARMSSSRQRLRSGRHRSTGASSAAPQGGSITSLASSYYRPPPLRASFSRHPSLRESQVEDPSAHRRAKRRPSFSSAPSPQAPHYSRCPGWQRRCPKQSYRPSSDDGLRVPRSVAS